MRVSNNLQKQAAKIFTKPCACRQKNKILFRAWLYSSVIHIWYVQHSSFQRPNQSRQSKWKAAEHTAHIFLSGFTPWLTALHSIKNFESWQDRKPKLTDHVKPIFYKLPNYLSSRQVKYYKKLQNYLSSKIFEIAGNFLKGIKMHNCFV
jgi:hypothetical protein